MTSRTSTPAGQRRHFARRWVGNWAHAGAPTEESTAAGIYGVIVGAAVMAAAHQKTAAGVATAVLFTLVVYWAAERYARLVAERIHQHKRPTWRAVRRQLTLGWEMVTASALPLAVLLIGSALGASLYVAVLSGLGTSSVILAASGWEMGRNGKLTRPERIVAASVAGLFGLAMIFLKTLLH